MRRSGVCTRGFHAPRARPQAAAAAAAAAAVTHSDRRHVAQQDDNARARSDSDDDDLLHATQRKRARSDSDGSNDGDDGAAATTVTTAAATSSSSSSLPLSSRPALPRLHHSPDVTRRVVYYPPAQPLSTLALACSSQQQPVVYMTQMPTAHDADAAAHHRNNDYNNNDNSARIDTTALRDTVVYNRSRVVAPYSHDTQQQQQQSSSALLPWQRVATSLPPPPPPPQQQQQLIGHNDLVATTPPPAPASFVSTQTALHSPPPSALAAASAFLCALDLQQQQQQQHAMSPSHAACTQTAVYDTPTRMLSWSQATATQQQLVQQQQAQPQLHVSPYAAWRTPERDDDAAAARQTRTHATIVVAACTPPVDADTNAQCADDTSHDAAAPSPTTAVTTAAAAATTTAAAANDTMLTATRRADDDERVHSDDDEDDDALAREVAEDVRMSADVAYTPSSHHDESATSNTMMVMTTTTATAAAAADASVLSQRAHVAVAAAAEPAAERVDDERVSVTPPVYAYASCTPTTTTTTTTTVKKKNDDNDDGDDVAAARHVAQQPSLTAATTAATVAASPPAYVRALECARAEGAWHDTPSPSRPLAHTHAAADLHDEDGKSSNDAVEDNNNSISNNSVHNDDEAVTGATGVATAARVTSAQTTRTTFRFASTTAAQTHMPRHDDDAATTATTMPSCRASDDDKSDATTTTTEATAAMTAVTSVAATAAPVASRGKRTRFVLSAMTLSSASAAVTVAQEVCTDVSLTCTKDEVADDVKNATATTTTITATTMAGSVADACLASTTHDKGGDDGDDMAAQRVVQQQQEQQEQQQERQQVQNEQKQTDDVPASLPPPPPPQLPGTFYDLPCEVGELFARHRGVRTLYPWQHDVLTRGDVRAGGNFIYSLPTSGGKTLVAEIALLRCVLLRRRSCLFVVPFVALAEEKTTALQPFADALGFTVDGHYGMTGRVPLPPPPALFVCTIEKANSVLNNLLEEGAHDSLGAVVVDELHMLGESRRGATLELLLSKLLVLNTQRARATAPPVQLLGMSATVPNLPAVARWLRASYYEGSHRPVPLQQYSVVEGMVLRDGEVNTRNLNGGSDLERLYELVVDDVPADASVLVFCASRQQCVDTACGYVRYVQQRSLNSAALAMRDFTTCATSTSTTAAVDTRRGDADDEAVTGVLPTSAIDALHALPRQAAGEVAALLVELHALGHHEAVQLAELLPYGVAFHHGGLLNEERELIERAYRARHVRVLCCTSTLAAGVNLPARRVVFKTPYIGREFLTKSRYTQMCGRAGRAGLDAHGESFLLLSRRDRVRGHALMHADLEPCCSQMLDDGDGFARALLECIGVRLVTCAADAYAWARQLLVVHAPGPVDATLRQAAAAAAAVAAATSAAPPTLLLASDSQSLCEAPAATTATTSNVVVADDKDTKTNEATGDANDDDDTRDAASTLQHMVSYALEMLQSHGLVRRGRTRDATATAPSSHKQHTNNNNSNHSNHSNHNNTNNDDGDVDDAAVVLEVTAFGASAVRSCFTVEEAIVVRSEFDQLRHTGLILADDLHLCYFVTPLREVGNCDWALYRVLLSRLNDTRQHIASLLGVDEYFVDQRASGLGGPPHTAPTSDDGRRKFFVARRFYVALMLADALSEVPMHEIEARYNVSRGQLQSLMRSASLFSSSITSFCHAMEWYALEAVLGSFVKRLDLGVKPDIVPLMELRGMQPSRARALWNAGLRDAAAIAACDADEMVTRVKRQNAADNRAAKFFSRRSALALIREAHALLERQLRARQGEVQALSTRLTRT